MQTLVHSRRQHGTHIKDQLFNVCEVVLKSLLVELWSKKGNFLSYDGDSTGMAALLHQRKSKRCRDAAGGCYRQELDTMSLGGGGCIRRAQCAQHTQRTW